MAVATMQKVRFLVHEDVASDFLGVLQDQGVVEWAEVKERKGLSKREKKNFEYNYMSSRLDYAVEFLSRYDTTRGKIKSLIEGTREYIQRTEVSLATKDFYVEDVVDRLEELQKTLNTAYERIKHLNKEQQLLQHWEALEISLGISFHTLHTRTCAVERKRLISAKDQDIYTLEKTFKKEKLPAVFFPAGSQERGLVTYHEAVEEGVMEILSRLGYEEVQLPKRRGTPREELIRIERAKNKEEQIIAKTQEAIRSILPHLPKLKILSDAMLWRKDKHNVLTAASGTKHVLVFEGWCPKKEVKILQKKIAEKTKRFVLERIQPEEGEEPPIALENSKNIKPFETITRLYGLPGYRELDPTAYLAGFFFVFFGLCLTDVFYGLFIFFLTAFVLHKYRVPSNVRPLVQLLMFGGLASAIIGIFFGGYFGIASDQIPSWARVVQIFNPLENPLPIFYLSLGLGFVQIMFGIFLKMLTSIKNGCIKDGILDEGPWLLFFAVLVWLGASTAVENFSGSREIALLALYSTIVLLVVTQGRKEKSFFMQLFKGIIGLYNIVGYFSDVLSYSRLLALGLATSALGFAVNLIAGIVNDMIPYVGFIFATLILVIGHTFNLAINSLGAFIHSARLQFVEFFGKFMTGGGRGFDPFERKQRYIAFEEKSATPRRS